MAPETQNKMFNFSVANGFVQCTKNWSFCVFRCFFLPIRKNENIKMRVIVALSNIWMLVPEVLCSQTGVVMGPVQTINCISYLSLLLSLEESRLFPSHLHLRCVGGDVWWCLSRDLSRWSRRLVCAARRSDLQGRKCKQLNTGHRTVIRCKG